MTPQRFARPACFNYLNKKKRFYIELFLQAIRTFNSNLDLTRSKPISYLKLAKMKLDNIALH